MKTITAQEFIDNLDSFMSQGIREEIKVINNDKVLFYLTPEKVKVARDYLDYKFCSSQK